MTSGFSIGDRHLGADEPALLVAELSANHNRSFERALELVRAAAEAGADAVKLQTYSADTITLDCKSDLFRRANAAPGQPRYLHELYALAATPWEWHAPLREEAERLGLIFFSTPFDPSAVEFLERLGVPAYKIASFELVDIPLIRLVARTGKPIVLSTGMGTLAEIEEAVRAIRGAGNEQLALLKCSSVYPARPEDLNLRTLRHMSETFSAPVGFSDHTLGTASAVAAVALGARIVEKHFTLSRAEEGPDSRFSLEPREFRQLVDAVREVELSLGRVSYDVSEPERANLVYRRSLFAVAEIKAGEPFTSENVRSIRPAHGLAPRHLDELLGRTASRDIARGTPLAWDLVD